MLDPEKQTQSTLSYDIAEDETVTQAVVRAVAAFSATPSVPLSVSEGTSDALDPLYSAIDPDALDSLFAPENAPEDARLQFQYNGYEITVLGGRRLALSEQ